MRKHQILLFILLLLISSFTFIELYNKIKYEYENNIKNVGDSLSERLLNINEVVDNGNGLYKMEKQYIYKGKVNNYIYFNNELWRIVSLLDDGTVKIVRNDLLRGYNLDNINKDYLNEIDNNKVTEHDFNVNSYDIYSIQTINDTLNLEEKYEKKYIGLLSVKDVVLASRNVYFDEYLDTYFWINQKYNYLYINDEWQLFNDVFVSGDFLRIGNVKNVRPVVYLKSNLYLNTGNGSKSNPYTLLEENDENIKK